MKFYSEKLKAFYDSEADCVKAEKDYEEKTKHEEEEKKRKASERKERAKKVEEAYNYYHKLLKEFIEDYGYFHMSIDEKSFDPVFDMFRFF